MTCKKCYEIKEEKKTCNCRCHTIDNKRTEKYQKREYRILREIGEKPPLITDIIQRKAGVGKVMASQILKNLRIRKLIKYTIIKGRKAYFLTIRGYKTTLELETGLMTKQQEEE